ncbi:MAG: urease accessory UreF family protein [Cyanobacteria bacterium J06627_28]
MTSSSSEQDYSAQQQLAMMQLADSFFPSGSYTLSHGLESLVQAGTIQTAEQVETFVRLLVCNKVGPMDAIALTHAHRASQQDSLSKLRDIDAHLFAQTPIEKTRLTQRQSGRALLMVANQTWPHSQLDSLQQLTAKGEFNCLHPVVFGVVAQVAGLSEQAARIAFIHGFVTGVLGAAIRLGTLGHVQAQQVRLALSADMARICDEAAVRSLDDMWACTPLIDLAQMRQAKLSRRLFAS